MLIIALWINVNMLLLLATVFTSPGCKKIFTRSKDAEISNPFNSALKIKWQRYQENNIMLENLGMKNSDKVMIIISYCCWCSVLHGWRVYSLFWIQHLWSKYPSLFLEDSIVKLRSFLVPGGLDRQTPPVTWNTVTKHRTWDVWIFNHCNQY